MSKFKSKITTTKDGIQIHFITRKNGKLISEEEMMEYAQEAGLTMPGVDTEEDWAPPNERMFLSDLRSGILFCSNKYGVAEEIIERYVRTKAPHITSSFLRRGSDGK